MYGARLADLWAGTNDDQVKAVWGNSISQFSPEVIGNAINLLERNGHIFPPTLPEFFALCKQAMGSTRPEHQPMLGLPPPDNSEETEAARQRCFANAKDLGLMGALRSAVEA